MSRQRLRPSLDEASHVICPRCNGQGTIRNVESLALSVLRLIQEEAMKDKTGRVVAQLPVKVATFLLNEKRDMIRTIEQRLRVGVLLIPNESLETPHFKLSRLRVEELSETQRLSYNLAEDYEEQYAPQVSAAIRDTGEEPVVKGVAPTTPAPPPPPAPAAKPEANPSFFSWLWGNLFGQPPQAQSPKDERPARPGGRPAKPERQRRERPGRRTDMEPATEAAAIKPTAAPVTAEAVPAPIPLPVDALRPELQPEVEPVVALIEDSSEETAAATETEEDASSNRNRRGRRGGRRRRRGETPTDAVAVDTEVAREPDADSEAPETESVTPTTPPAAMPQRRIRSGRPRLPREILAAAAAESAAPAADVAAVELSDELPAPPLQRLEYPVVEDDREVASPAMEMPVQPLDQTERASIESVEPPVPPVETFESVEPALPEVETTTHAIDTEAVTVEPAVSEAPVAPEATVVESVTEETAIEAPAENVPTDEAPVAEQPIPEPLEPVEPVSASSDADAEHLLDRQQR
jgi:ribonuclease E